MSIMRPEKARTSRSAAISWYRLIALLTLNIRSGIRDGGPGIDERPVWMPAHQGIIAATGLVAVPHRRRASGSGPSVLANGTGAVAPL